MKRKGFIRRDSELQGVPASECGYCQETFIASESIIQDWEAQHERLCSKRRAAIAPAVIAHSSRRHAHVQKTT